MPERKGLVTMHGAPLTLVGANLKVGDTAPDAEIVDNTMNLVRLSSFKGMVCILSAVTSLDTSVCDIETKKFNKEAESFGSDFALLTISMDLPFAQKRWCGSAGIENAKTFSDYRSASFGEKYGVLIKELRLLARAIFVVDRKGIIRYIQIVPEISKEPDYDAALAAAKELF